MLPKGHTAETIVRDVIEKTFAEERNWDPDRGELLPWLKWVVKSDLSHLAESAANQKDVHFGRFDNNETELDQIEKESNKQPHIQKNFLSPEDAMVVIETKEEAIELARLKIDLLLDACKGKSELEEIVYAICEGKCSAKPQALSEYLGRPIDEVNQQLRTLRRKAAKMRIEADYGRE